MMMLLVACLLPLLAYGTRFTMTLKDRQEDCYQQQFNAQFSGNRIFFRFNIIEADTYDGVDLVIKSPSNIILKEWKDSKGGHVIQTIRESGLHMFCFRKNQYAKKHLTVLYNLEFVSVGSRMLTNYPVDIGTISKDKPDALNQQKMEIQKDTKMGVFDFDMSDVSETIVNENTRVMVLLSVEYDAGQESMLNLRQIPSAGFNAPVTWNVLKKYAENPDSLKLVDSYPARTGEGIYFDVTDLVVEALKKKDEKLAFMVEKPGAGVSKVFSMRHTASDHWPTLIFEDQGSETMSELADFKEYLFELRGELTYMIHSERLSRDVVESTNSRVMWSSIWINITLFCISGGQILYVRNLLKTGSY